MNVIHLTDAMKEMKGEKPFSIVYVTCDVNRKTGGDIMKLDNVIFSFNNKAADLNDFDLPEASLTGRTKRANHYEHATRNVLLPNGMRRKFHIRLLLQFNGKKVFY